MATPRHPATVISLLTSKIQVRDISYIIYAFSREDYEAAVSDLIVSGDTYGAGVVFACVPLNDIAYLRYSSGYGYLACMDWVSDFNKLRPTPADYTKKRTQSDARPALERSKCGRWADEITTIFSRVTPRGNVAMMQWIPKKYPEMPVTYNAETRLLAAAAESGQVATFEVLHSKTPITAVDVFGSQLATLRVIFRDDLAQILKWLYVTTDVDRGVLNAAIRGLMDEHPSVRCPNINKWLDDRPRRRA
jgi:hypothetical protein